MIRAHNSRMAPISATIILEPRRGAFNRPPARADWRAMSQPDTTEFLAFAGRLADAAAAIVGP